MIQREISRVLVLNLSGDTNGDKNTDRRSLSLTLPSLLSRGSLIRKGGCLGESGENGFNPEELSEVGRSGDGCVTFPPRHLSQRRDTCGSIFWISRNCARGRGGLYAANRRGGD